MRGVLPDLHGAVICGSGGNVGGVHDPFHTKRVPVRGDLELAFAEAALGLCGGTWVSGWVGE